MKNISAAFLFPGQGAQKVGMGKDFFDASKAARAVFEEADDALNEKLSDLIFNGPEEALTLTANTQPAILTVSIAALRAFQERCDLAPRFVAGHSLGEFSALVAAGCLSLGDAVRVTRARGRFMQEAVPAGHGGMAAVVGDIAFEKLKALCEEASKGRHIVAPANLNAPGQVVISGHLEAVGRAGDLLEGMDLRVIPLPVSAPFHSVLMAPAAERLREVLESVDIGAFSIPVVTNVEATPNADASRARELLVRQVTAPVRWVESMIAIINEKMDIFVELGPGNVLAGLMRRIDKKVTMVSVNSIGGLDKALSSLEKL